MNGLMLFMLFGAVAGWTAGLAGLLSGGLYCLLRRMGGGFR